MSDGRIRLEAAAQAIRDRSPEVQPRLAFVLGSGMGPVAEELEDAALERRVAVDYRDIPHFPVPTGQGHDGRLVLGHVAGIPSAILQGRVHLYEGYSPQEVVFPIRVLERLGVRTLVLTNAAGGVGSSLEVGDLVLIEDHLSFANLSGLDPTRGTEPSPSGPPASGPRFTSLNGAYDRSLRERARQVARESGVELSSGVYAHVVGPAFETPAEIRFLRAAGADVVGMSTVPEVIAARQAGIRVLAISCVTNLAIDRIDTEASTSAEEVFENLERILPRLGQLLAGVARGLAAQRDVPDTG